MFIAHARAYTQRYMYNKHMIYCIYLTIDKINRRNMYVCESILLLTL